MKGTARVARCCVAAVATLRQFLGRLGADANRIQTFLNHQSDLTDGAAR